jgi:hypothetical protein
MKRLMHFPKLTQADDLPKLTHDALPPDLILLIRPVTIPLPFTTPCLQGGGKMISNDGKAPMPPPLQVVPANKPKVPPWRDYRTI